MTHYTASDSWPVLDAEGRTLSIHRTWQAASCALHQSKARTILDFRGGVWTYDADYGSWTPSGFPEAEEAS